MLKKIYIKNGTILVSTINNMEINYNIINCEKKDINESIKKYYKKKELHIKFHTKHPHKFNCNISETNHE